jgi:hypothetical protein
MPEEFGGLVSSDCGKNQTLSAVSVYENTKVINRGIALLGLEFVNITIEDAE